MASTTTNLGLTKPAYTDDADVAVINANSDIIDSAYGSLSDQMANKANKNVSISYYSLIDRVAITKTATDYTFYNNRSLATYPTISIQPIIGGYFRQGLVIPRNHFNNPSTGKFSLYCYSGGEQVEIVINYVDDSKINMKYNASGTLTVEIIIDGLVNGAG